MLINANTQSLFSAEALKSVDKTMSTAMERLSSGKQVNSAGDNPAGLAMSTLLSADIQAIGQSVRNVNDAISLIQTAEGATQEITNMLQRMRELAVQAVNDTNSEADRSYLNLEFQQLKQEIVRITEMTEWNGFKVLDGSAGVQLGEIPVYKVVSHGLSGETLLIDERVQVIEGETAGETQQWAFTGQPQSGVLRIADAEITLTEDEANTDLSTFVETIATKLRQTDNFNDSSGRDITVSGSSLLVTYSVADGQQDLADLTPSSEDFSMVATVRSEAMISAEEFFSNQMEFRSAGLLTIEIDEVSDTPGASFTLPDGEVIQLVGTLDRSAGLVTFVKSDGDNQRLFVSDADSDTLSYAFRDADNGAVSLSGRAVLLNVGVEGAIPGLRAGDLQINGVEVGRSFAGDDLVSPRNNATGSGIAKAAAINRVSSDTGVYARVNTTLMPGQAISDTTAVTGVITINGVRTGDIESIAYDSAATRRQVIDAVNAISHRTGVKAAQLGDDETGITLLAEDGRNIEVAFVTPFNKSVFGRGVGLRGGVQASTISLESKIPQPVQLTSSFTGDISRIGFREGDFSLNQTHYHTADRAVSLPPQAQVDGIQLGNEMALGDAFSVIVNGTQFTSDDSYEAIQDARDDLVSKINSDPTLGVIATAGRTQDEILLEAQVAGVPFSASVSDTSADASIARYIVQPNQRPSVSTLGENDLVINGVKIRSATNSDDNVSSIIPKSSSQAASAIATANAVNSHFHQTGVRAEPIGPVSKGLITDTSLVPSTTNSSVQTLYLNGVAVDIDFVRDEPEGIRREKVVKAINERFGMHGVTASNNGQGVSLTTDGRNLSVWFDSDISGLSAAHFGLAGSDAVAQVSTINFDTAVAEVEPAYPIVEEGVDYIEYSDGGRVSETLSIQETTPPDITSDAMSFSNGILYRGTGTSAEIVGRVDPVLNGVAGAPLRINYGYEFANGGLDGPLTGGPTVYSLDGWTIYNEQVRLDGLSQIAGWPTPEDSNDPNGSGGNPPVEDTAKHDGSWVGSVSIESDLSRDSYLQLTTGNGSFRADSYAVIHGPYLVSDSSIQLTQGDIISFDWKAEGGGDSYDVFGYLLNTDTGQTIELLNSSEKAVRFGGPTPAWTTVSQSITSTGQYKFVFVGGTFDWSGLRQLDAALQVDSISISAAPPTFTAEQIESITSQVSYVDTSPPVPDPDAQTFTVSINGVSVTSDSVGSAQEGAENLASKIREKISAGEITNIEIELQGDDIIVRSTVAGTAFDIGGVSIDGEGQTTMSVGTQIPNELDTGVVTGIPNANELSDAARTAYGTVRLIASPASVGGDSDTKAPTLIHIEAGLNGYTREGDFIGLGFEEGIFGGRSSQEMDPPRVGRLTFQVGSRHEEQLTIDIPDIGPRGAVTGRITLDSRLNANDQIIRLDSRESASKVLDYLDEAMFEVDRFRGHLGANSSRLSNIIDNLQTTTFNRESSRSQIMDADYASESTELIKSQLLQQASTATLAQANASQKFVLEMLRG